MLLLPPKTIYNHFFSKFISYKFVLARLGAKSKLFASISPPSAIPETLAVIVRRHAKQTGKQINKQNLNLQNGTI